MIFNKTYINKYEKLKEYINEYKINVRQMGFPDDWETNLSAIITNK